MTEKKLNILYGLNWQQGAERVAKILSTNGYDVTSTSRLSKATIKAYIEDHPEVNTVVLKESVGDGTYKADEIAELTDYSDVNVIVILNERHKGTAYMQTLYTAGVTCAIFENKKGITPSDVAKLMMKKRTRAEARNYYDIGNETVNTNILSPFDYQTFMARLEDREYGSRLIERFLNVANKLRPAQLEDFIKKLPNDYLDELKSYKEFYDVCESLKAYGITPPYKMPRGNVRKALTTVSYDDIPSESNVAPATTVNTTDDANDYSGLFDAFMGNAETEQPVNETVAENVSDTSTDNMFDAFMNDGNAPKTVAETEEIEITEEMPTEDTEVVDLTQAKGKRSKKDKKSKAKKEKKEGSGKVVVASIFGFALVILAACGVTYEIVQMQNGNKNKVAAEQEAVSDDLIAEETTGESVSEDVASEDGTVVDTSTDDTTNDAQVVDTMYTVPTSESIDAQTGLVTADETANDQYSNEPETVTSNYSGNVLFDGLVVSGVEVVNIINANPTTRFTVTNPYTNEVTVYTSGGASLADIPETSTYKLTAVDGAYIFSLSE